MKINYKVLTSMEAWKEIRKNRGYHPNPPEILLGYKLVIKGQILPTDLVYSNFSKKWKTVWLKKTPCKAEDFSYYIIRKKHEN